jgi:aldehyde dehydrogenase (NAD+)
MKSTAKALESTVAANPFQGVFDKQQAYFATDATKTYQWRIDQLDRLSRLLKENEKRFPRR